MVGTTDEMPDDDSQDRHPAFFYPDHAAAVDRSPPSVNAPYLNPPQEVVSQVTSQFTPFRVLIDQACRGGILITYLTLR